MPRRKSRDTSFELPLLPRCCGIISPDIADLIMAGRRASVRAAEEPAWGESVVTVTGHRDREGVLTAHKRSHDGLRSAEKE